MDLEHKIPVYSSPGKRLLLVLLLGWLSAAASAQVVEEDLDLDGPVIAPEIETLFRDAEALFGTLDMPDSVPLFEQVIGYLEPLASSGESEIDQRLSASYVYVARVHHNLGDLEATRSALTRLLQHQPDFVIDREVAHPEVVTLFEQTRESMIGFVEFVIEPADSTLSVGGRTFRAQQGPQTTLVGTYVAEASRPGYIPASFPFEVTAGNNTTVEGQLERSSAVIVVRTRPSEALVLLNRVEVGRTAGEAEPEFVATGDAAVYPRAEFSSLAMIDMVPVGEHRLEVIKEGYRPYVRKLAVDSARDFLLRPILLEEEAGTVVLNNMPADAEVFLDGERRRVERQGSALPKMTLRPGSYRVQITQGTTGVFESAIDVTDRGVVNLQVELRPALALLGILGRDEVAKQRLGEGLFDALEKLGDWSLLDRSLEAAPLLDRLGLETEILRAAAPGAQGPDFVWQEVRAALDRELPASIYLLAVLSDDLLAKEADLWIWSAEPGPSRPERRRVAIETEDLDRLATGFRPTIGRVKPILGARAIDSKLAESPIVASVVANGPAASASIAPGDRIVSIDGATVASVRDLEARIAAVEGGQVIELMVEREGRLNKKTVTTGRSYRVIDLADSRVVYSALASAVNAELQRESEWPRWVLQLNRAGILMRAGDYEGAVRQLNGIDPASLPGSDAPGLGRGHLDYWLGLALTQAGVRYAADAREAFARAARAEDSRLYSDDGPLVAPRARARLERLGGAP